MQNLFARSGIRSADGAGGSPPAGALWRGILKGLLFAGAAALFLAFYRCPIRLLFGINCPGCGMTRAFYAALRLDLAAAFDYHPLFPLFGAETLYVFLRLTVLRRAKISGRAEIAVAVLSLALLLGVWIFRQFIL